MVINGFAGFVNRSASQEQHHFVNFCPPLLFLKLIVLGKLSLLYQLGFGLPLGWTAFAGRDRTEVRLFPRLRVRGIVAVCTPVTQ